MKKLYYHNLIFVIALSALFFALSGCGGNAPESVVPELIEPVTASASFRPVAKRVTGPIEVLKGYVVPASYAVFSTDGVELSEIKVAVGDKVEEGDVIAKESSSAIEDEITRIKDQIASLEREREKDERIFALDLQRLYYEGHDNGVDKEYLTCVENHRYDIAVIDERLKDLRTRLKEREEKRKGREFKAPHSGTVVFVKDMTAGNRISPYENIAVIADENDLYIECRDVNIKKYKYEKYESKWTVIDGEMTDIQEYPYSNSETAYANATEQNPPMRFLVSGNDLNIGDDALLFFMREEAVERLCVGNDSIYSETGEQYVYVKTGEGDDTEKRMITTGRSDGNYTEVLSGLSDNDIVYYKNNIVPPTKYTESEVKLKDYGEETIIKNVETAKPYYDIYVAPHGGDFKKIHDPGSVKKDDELYMLTYVSGRADTEAGRVSLEDLDLDRAAYLKAYEKSRKAIIDAAGEVSETVSDNDALMAGFRTQLAIIDLENEYAALEYEEQKKIRNREYNKLRSENGSKDDVIKAKTDGVVGFITVNDRDPLSRGDYVLTVSRTEDKEGTRLNAVIPSGGTGFVETGYANIGKEIKLSKNGNTIATGRCIGVNGDKNRFILFTKDEKQFATYSAPFEKGGELRFFAETYKTLSENDIKNSQLTFNGFLIRNAITVPATAVRTEVNPVDDTEKYYVWKIENGDKVKEYVTIYKTNAKVTDMYVISGVDVGDVVLVW